MNCEVPQSSCTSWTFVWPFWVPVKTFIPPRWMQRRFRCFPGLAHPLHCAHCLRAASMRLAVPAVVRVYFPLGQSDPASCQIFVTHRYCLGASRYDPQQRLAPCNPEDTGNDNVLELVNRSEPSHGSVHECSATKCGLVSSDWFHCAKAHRVCVCVRLRIAVPVKQTSVEIIPNTWM